MSTKADPKKLDLFLTKATAMTRESFENLYRNLTGNTAKNQQELDEAWNVVKTAMDKSATAKARV